MTQLETTETVHAQGHSPRLLVVAGPGVNDLELRRAAEEPSWWLHDARSEQPAASVDELVADHVLATPDVVVCLGSRTATAEALALVHGVPLATTSTVAPKRVESLAAALCAGSEVRCAVLDMRIDGSRRFAVQHVAVGGESLAVRGLDDRVSPWSPLGATARVSPAGAESAKVALHDSAGWCAYGNRVVVTASRGWIGMRGPHQRFDRLDVEVHPSPLRQVVVGGSLRRRPVVDTVPL